jgi:hypothetical protein
MKTPKYVGTLIAIYSRSPSAGTAYWAMRFIDHLTGKVVEATVGGGESNIYGILRYWKVKNDWDRSLLFQVLEQKTREFDRMVKNWPYAGSNPDDLAAFIKKELKKP